ncbi:hypothetical protein FEM48_Zijuj02G0098200 [Ziziphus jujuba var. spinosa]|uniref:Uncharacterized protein n=1 Tax=Ziziphus jujuba var. spinosa TaxID=714518 RepID=A0A978VV20_ZIZJJ|nr:hypothetical protein FEM48_Zijuj02G0098200 [Ziziphus jujuba var. spinosa]
MSKLASDAIPNMFTCKPYKVDPDIPFFTASEDEPGGIEHFLGEPECKDDLVSNLLDLDMFQIQKCFDVEDISGTFDDTMRPNLTQGEGENLEFLYEMFQGSNNGDVRGQNTLSTSEEFLLDAKYADDTFKLDHGPCKDSYLGNVALQTQSPGIHKRDSASEILDLSSVGDPVFKCMNNHSSLHDHIAVEEVNEAFKNMSEYETSVMDSKWLQQHEIFGLKNYFEMENGLSLMKFDLTTIEHEGKTSSNIDYAASTTEPVIRTLNNENISGNHQVKRKRLTGSELLKTMNSDVRKVELFSFDGEDKAEPLVTQKRSRKPPRRYIEESLDYSSKSSNRKCGMAYRRSKDQFLHVKSQKQKWQNEFQAVQVFPQEDSFDGNCIQVPFDLPMEREHSKKNKSFLVKDAEDCKDNRLLCPVDKLDVEALSAESQEDVSEDECMARSYAKGGGRRKRHISWTPSEVVKLVEGVSQCGVGRWTEIKRLLFSSSSHRTSVDLKDKWRNLLRASCTQLQIKEKVENGRKQATNHIPESVLWRVRELAIMHPYPRESRSKVSCTAPAVSSFTAATDNTLVPLPTAV